MFERASPVSEIAAVVIAAALLLVAWSARKK
jgi:hypothetical protein